MSNIMDESHKGRDPAYEGTVMEIAGKMAPDRAMGFCAGHPHRGSFGASTTPSKRKGEKG